MEEHYGKVYHGIATMVKTVVDDELLFEGLGNDLKWDAITLGLSIHFTKCWKRLPLMKMVKSFARHRTFDVPVQFHPESVNSNGKNFKNWVE
jgi:anthranilate synthase component 2